MPWEPLRERVIRPGGLDRVLMLICVCFPCIR